MVRMSSLLVAVVGVLAFAVPATANAAVPTLQEQFGTPVKTGTTILGVGSEVTLTSTTIGEVSCYSIVLEGVVSVNDMTNGITGGNSGQKGPPTMDCTNGSNTVNVTNVTLTDLKSSVGGEMLASFNAELDIGASTKCTYKGTDVKGTYANGGTVVTFSDATGVTSSPPACGVAKLDGEFTLELANDRPVKGVF